MKVDQIIGDDVFPFDDVEQASIAVAALRGGVLMPLWSASEAMAATGGQLLLCLGTLMGCLLTRAHWRQVICLSPSALVRDGHEFVAQALASWRGCGS